MVGLEYANKDHIDKFQDDIVRISITADNNSRYKRQYFGMPLTFVGLCGLFLHDNHHFLHPRIIAALNQNNCRPCGCIRRISWAFKK